VASDEWLVARKLGQQRRRTRRSAFLIL
jgi:hypothetical protein